MSTMTDTQTTFKNTILVHDALDDDRKVVVRGNRADVTLTLEDGRTVQVGVLNNGRVLLRAWGANPYATNNLDSCSVSFTLPTLEDQILDGAQVSDLNFHTSTPTERSLPSPDNHDSCWHLASEAIRDRVQGIRTLLALRKTHSESR